MRFLFFLGTVLALRIAAQSAVVPSTYEVPILALACHFDPAFITASGYDCRIRSGLEKQSVLLHTELSLEEKQAIMRERLYRAALSAEQRCGTKCRSYYATMGRQCMAVSQNDYYSGLGAFMGIETTQKQAELTSLAACENFVGQPQPKSCSVVISECP